MRHPVLWTLTAAAALGVAGLGTRRVRSDRRAAHIEADLLAGPSAPGVFSSDTIVGLPEPAQRYLRHAIAPGTPLVPAVRLEMTGTMTPTPDAARVALRAVEVLAPRRGFVWTAEARMVRVPVRVRDHYFEGEGGVHVALLGLVPLPFSGAPEDLARSARGRLVGEAVWCPTALVGPGVLWEAVDADRARFTLAVDGVPICVTIRVGPDGALREVTLDRWGDVGVAGFRPIPYGFAVEAEATFGGVTIPTRIRGGWWFGTDRFDPATAATFTVASARFGAP
ncbi:MAG: DUF6544 family protein [Rhodothermales bacterium]